MRQNFDGTVHGGSYSTASPFVQVSPSLKASVFFPPSDRASFLAAFQNTRWKKVKRGAGCSGWDSLSGVFPSGNEHESIFAFKHPLNYSAQHQAAGTGNVPPIDVAIFAKKYI